MSRILSSRDLPVIKAHGITREDRIEGNQNFTLTFGGDITTFYGSLIPHAEGAFVLGTKVMAVEFHSLRI